MSEGRRTIFKPIYLERFRSPLHGPGGRGKGRADELLPIAVGGVVPGVGLDNQLLPPEAQTTPADQRASQERRR